MKYIFGIYQLMTQINCRTLASISNKLVARILLTYTYQETFNRITIL